MNDLSREAKALLREARAAFSPPEGRLETIRSALKTQLGPAYNATPSTASPVSGVATRAVAGAGWTAGHTFGAAVLIGALGAGGAAAWLMAHRSGAGHLAPAPAAVGTSSASDETPSALEPGATPPDTAPPVIATPTWQASPSDVAPFSKSSAIARERARTTPRTRAKVEATAPHETPVDTAHAAPGPAAPAAAPPAADSLAEEVSMLRGARSALDRGDATRALLLLDAHETRFQRATLYEERLATRVLALCALGRVDAARATARELERAAPHSPHLPRVRASCVAPSSGK